ncbi:MAG TPA: ABC transporter substrate-binding protein [Candidatus Limnocylindrales bacterium]|nr:ABC transporter substrate-binding protein [Candidatus Limnocylindrales bacterium]
MDASFGVWSRRSGGGRRSLLALVLGVLVAAACVAPSGQATPAPSSTPAASAPAATLASPSPSPSPSPAVAYPLELTDDEGNAVVLEAEPRRIVSLTPATTEILFALGAGDRVVATTDFDDYPPEAVPLPDVATYTSVDVEKIVGLDADLVIAGGNNFNDPDALARLRSLGIPVLVVYAPDIATVLRDIELIGRAVGRAAEAATLVAWMRAEFERVAVATAGLPKPRVFYELDATTDIYGPADDSFLEEMIRLAGGDPLTTGSPTVFSIPLEKLVAADPEVIVLGDANYGVTPEQVAARPGWGSMTAVKRMAIRPVDDIVVTRPGPRLVEGLRALALAIHPDLALPSPAPVPSLAPAGG